MNRLTLIVLAIVSYLQIPSSLALALPVGQLSTFSFESTIRRDLGTYGPGTPVSGAIIYSPDAVDTNPNSMVGEYEILIESYSVTVGDYELAGGPITGSIVIKDNYGCDCFFIEVPHEEVVGGVFFNRLLVDIQDELSLTGMITSDAIPLHGLAAPDSISRWFEFFHVTQQGGSQLVGQARISNLSLTTIPEPTTLTLAVFALLGLVGGRWRGERSRPEAI